MKPGHRQNVGKGGWYRDVNRKKYEDHWDAIFGKKPLPDKWGLTFLDLEQHRDKGQPEISDAARRLS